MFNFTTLTIYNQISDSGANRNLWAVSGKKPALRIGNTRFDADDILDILVKNPTIENLAEVKFDLTPLITKATTENSDIIGRFVLYVGLSMNSQDSFYANPHVYKGKPLTIEFPVKLTDDTDTLAQRIVSIAKKHSLLVMGSELIITVEANASTPASGTEGDPGYVAATPGSVTFKGVNGYQLIKKAILQWFDPDYLTVDCCTRTGEYLDLVVGVPVVYTTDADGEVTITSLKLNEAGTKVSLASDEVAITPGIEAFGDYNWIIHNLRLPTAANTGFWAPTKHMGEMPIVGQVYTQFIIRMCKERDGISGEIVGARAKSVTTHVLYVAGKVSDGSSAAKAVNDALFGSSTGQLNLSAKKKTDADTKLVAPFGA